MISPSSPKENFAETEILYSSGDAINGLYSMVGSLVCALDGANASFATAVTESSHLHKRIGDLEQEMKDLRHHNDDLEDKLSDATAAISIAQQHLEDSQRELEDHNISHVEELASWQKV